MKAKKVWLLAAGAVLVFVGWRVREATRSNHNLARHLPVDATPSLTERRNAVVAASSGLQATQSPPGQIPVRRPLDLAVSPDERLAIRREIFSVERPAAPQLMFDRIRVVETDFHYPFVRIAERVLRDPRGGREIILRRTAMVADHVLVKLRDAGAVTAIEGRAAQAGLRVRQTIQAGRTVLLEFPVGTGDSLTDAMAVLSAESDWIEHVEPDFLVTTCVTPNDPAYSMGNQWGPQFINAPVGWSTRTDASNSIVAVIDTGMRLAHEDLAANLWRNLGETSGGRNTNNLDDDGNGYVDDTHGIDAITLSGLTGDDHGHGTHVAGIIGARGDNGLGLAGVAWRVRLMPLKFLNASGVGAISDAIVCLDYARRNGAHIVNASWGGTGESQLLLEAMTRCTEAGMVIVAAAGNNGADLDMSPMYPASFAVPGLITVASVDVTGRLSWFSNYGAAHLAAPGEGIYSTWHENDSSYRSLSGTSMAAPHVAGALALLRQQYAGESGMQLVNRLLAGGEATSKLNDRVAYGCHPDLGRSLAQTNVLTVPSVATPATRTVRIGDSLNLAVSVQGTPPFTYQWHRDELAISGATGSQLALTDIQPSAGGAYHVVVENAAASVRSRLISVVVVGPPKIVTQPTSQTVVAGNDITLSVTTLAQGAPSLEFQWFRDGSPVTDAVEPRLQLERVSSAQAGMYHVVVTSEHGVVRSQLARLTVVAAESPTITRQPEPVSISANGTARFSVQARGTPTLTYQWHKNGVAIAGATAATLEIVRAQEADVGDYSVLVTNSGGSATSQAATLTVRFAPVAPFIVQEPVGRTAFIGETIALSVVAKGTPTPSVQWLHNGVDLPGATQPTLTLAKVTVANEGSYAVRISNSRGSVTSKSVFLTIESGVGNQRWEWRNPLPHGNHYNGLCRIGDSFVAVGAFGVIVTSPNGVAWTMQSSGVRETLIAVAANGSHVVAVGVRGAIVASDDGGATWSPRVAGTEENIRDIAYGLGLFIAVGEGGSILSSPDGRTWTRRTSKTDALSAVVFGDGQFVIGALNGQMLHSTNGTQWTRSKVGESINSLAYGNQTFIAECPGAAGGVVLTSRDGKSWKRRYQSSSYFTQVAFVRDTFVLLGTNQDVFTSSDGNTWVRRYTGFSGYPREIAHSAGTFVIVGHVATIYTSPDLASWTTRAGDRWNAVTSVVHGRSGFVAVGEGSLRDSPTGVLWRHTATGTLRNKVVYLNDRYIAVGLDDVESSFEGRTWSNHKIPGAFNLQSIAWGAGVYVAVDQNGKIFTSPDLARWTERALSVAEFLSDVEYGNGQFVVVGWNGTILISPDGMTWSLVRSGIEADIWNDLYGVAYDGKRWVAVGPRNWILHSVDGRRWSRVFRDGEQAVNSVTYAAGHFLAVGTEGTLLVSTDGVRWTERSAGTSMPLYDVCAGPDSLVVVGLGETILQSGTLAATQPMLTPTPARQVAETGGATVLEIESVGTGELKYRWMRNGIMISGATERILQLRNLEFDQAGSYTVAVQDGDSTIVSHAAFVAVVGPAPPSSHLFPRDASHGSVRLSGPAEFNWTAGTVTPWLTITSATSGAGTNDVQFNVARNDTGTVRRGSIVIGGHTISIEQAGLSIITQPQSQFAAPGGTATLAATASSGPAVDFRWQRNGVAVSGSTGAELTVDNLQPEHTGIYTAIVANGNANLATEPAILGLAANAKIIGSASELGSDIQHLNGNAYDQILLDGKAAAITADPNQITRMSFIDLNDDIVQLEFSGPGTVSLVLDADTGPALPLNYNQDLPYMKGHAGIVVTGATENTHLSVFSVGRANAVNQALFRDNVAYDGVADISFIAILSENGQFGGLRTANTSYFATSGLTGIYAPGVQFTGPVFVADISAAAEATPVLVFGSAADVRITGGDLLQTNGRAVQVSGLTHVRLVDGATSHDRTLPAQDNRARLEENGVDVTGRLVVNP